MSDRADLYRPAHGGYPGDPEEYERCPHAIAMLLVKDDYHDDTALAEWDDIPSHIYRNHVRFLDPFHYCPWCGISVKDRGFALEEAYATYNAAPDDVWEQRRLQSIGLTYPTNS